MKIQLPSHLKGKKASDTFMDYIEPFVNTLFLDPAAYNIPNELSLKELEQIFKTPWCIWNAIVAEKDPNNTIDCLSMFKILTYNFPEHIQRLNDFMIRRKRSHFSQYEYYLGKYKLYYNNNNELRLKMESSLPSETPANLVNYFS